MSSTSKNLDDSRIEYSNYEVQSGTWVTAVFWIESGYRYDVQIWTAVRTAVPRISVVRISQVRRILVPEMFSGTEIYWRFYGSMKGTRCIWIRVIVLLDTVSHRSSTRIVLARILHIRVRINKPTQTLYNLQFSFSLSSFPTLWDIQDRTMKATLTKGSTCASYVMTMGCTRAKPRS